MSESKIPESTADALRKIHKGGDLFSLMTKALNMPCSKSGCCGRLPVLYRVESEDGWRLGCSGFASAAPTLIATLHGWLDKNEVRDVG